MTEFTRTGNMGQEPYMNCFFSSPFLFYDVLTGMKDA
jgi:hypothetical protein